MKQLMGSNFLKNLELSLHIHFPSHNLISLKFPSPNSFYFSHEFIEKIFKETDFKIFLLRNSWFWKKLETYFSLKNHKNDCQIIHLQMERKQRILYFHQVLV